MKQFIFFYFLLIQSSIWSQSDTARFILRTYGFNSWNEYDQLEDSIAGNWKITYLPVAGCVVTDEFVDSINRLNEITYSNLKAHYGSEWKERFTQEVDAAYTNLLCKKEITFRETANCTTEEYSFKTIENLSQNRMKFLIIPEKAKDQSNHDVHLIGLQHIDSTILYRGYKNILALEFGSFADTISVSIKSKGELQVLDSCPSSTKIQLRYKTPWSEKHDTLLVETTDGHIQQYIFNIKNLETPGLYFNELLLDSTLRISKLQTTSVLSMHYDKNCLIPDRFTIYNWEISYPGSKRHIGQGSIIPISVMRKLKKLKPGTRCCVQVTASSSDSVLRKKIVCVTLI